MFIVIFCGQSQLSFRTDIYNNTNKRREVLNDRTYPTLRTKSMLETEANPARTVEHSASLCSREKTYLFFKCSRSPHLRYLFWWLSHTDARNGHRQIHSVKWSTEDERGLGTGNKKMDYATIEYVGGKKCHIISVYPFQYIYIYI